MRRLLAQAVLPPAASSRTMRSSNMRRWVRSLPTATTRIPSTGSVTRSPCHVEATLAFWAQPDISTSNSPSAAARKNRWCITCGAPGSCCAGLFHPRRRGSKARRLRLRSRADRIGIEPGWTRSGPDDAAVVFVDHEHAGTPPPARSRTVGVRRGEDRRGFRAFPRMLQVDEQRALIGRGGDAGDLLTAAALQEAADLAAVRIRGEQLVVAETRMLLRLLRVAHIRLDPQQAAGVDAQPVGTGVHVVRVQRFARQRAAVVRRPAQHENLPAEPCGVMPAVLLAPADDVAEFTGQAGIGGVGRHGPG